jgi:hypothetical protein
LVPQESGKLALKALKVQWDRKDKWVPKDCQAKPVQLGLLDLKGFKDPTAPRELRAQQDPRDHKDTLDLKALKVFRVFQARLAVLQANHAIDSPTFLQQSRSLLVLTDRRPIRYCSIAKMLCQVGRQVPF